MVRTKATAASASVRVVAAKAPRKSLGGPSRSCVDLSSPSSKKDKSVGVNSVCPRPTPEWQKPIGHFFNVVPRDVKAQADGVGDEKSLDSPPKKTLVNSHDDKENRDPEEEIAGPSRSPDEQPHCSTKPAPKSKRKRIAVIEDSDDDDAPVEEKAATSHGHNIAD